MTLRNSYAMGNKSSSDAYPSFCWNDVETVFLDMDGTLLDKYYDDYFWEHFVPEMYSRHHDLEPEETKKQLLKIYQSVEGTLQWTDLDYWSHRLELDIPMLKKEIIHLVNILPHVTDFLYFLKKRGKNIYLITNAHPKTLAIKMEKVQLSHLFTQSICSKEVGAAKEQPEFWEKLQTLLSYDSTTTFFADDTEKVLDSAAAYGISHLVHIAKPSTRLPATFSKKYLSVINFKQCIVE